MAGRPRDEEARRVILRQAADIASRDGLEGLSIGRLAGVAGVSKSGLFGFFGSKEELQLATVAVAADVYLAEVVRPALTVPPGVTRLRRLCDSWLSYSQRRVFPGGCFFFAVTAEFDARPGRVRDAIAAAARQWRDLVEQTVTEARDLGDLVPATDPGQLAFELIAFLETANAMSLLHDDPWPYERARIAIDSRLTAAAVR
ncbi:TetR family transcriptional regulator [Actinoplanes ianthinogenes]|uniref:TetR family transcriptional regulator n=1 Tax=Actinoplanes ianthinogenes TaxID=122358 RepID=A0ABM7LNK3_9ACTN|nr:TetR/AcrR family transcriptional regulator [Actinoplanes ianthinogenes]BCJ40825.1 TetR family transcriptional regulator [Actinoplanes ianthinogenes]GGR24960.1 TetR family transcriptional regulator [Actinoplanes ianthinogenes]